MTEQVVTLRIDAKAASVGPAAAAAARDVGKIGEAAAAASTKSTAATGKIVQGTQAVGAGATTAATRLEGMGRAGAQAGDQVAIGARKGAAGLRETVQEAARAQLSVRSVVQSAAQLAGIAIGANLVRGAIQLADGYTNLSSKLRNVAEDESALARVRQAAFQVAQDTRQELAATAELYTSLTRSTEALGLAESQRLRITETINKSFVISGASAQAANNAIVQLSQGLASGALRGDEFNSVAEQAPILMDLLASSLGRTRGELREMAAQGQITAEVLATALLQGSAEVDRQFENMALTVSASITQLANAIQRWVGSSSEGIGASALLAESISLVARNVDPLANLVVALSLAWSGKYVVGIVAAKVAAMAKLQANVQLAASELALATASEASAAAQARQAVLMGGSRAATEALAAAQARTAAATTALNAAQAANVGLMSRAGAGLLALAGGPWGVAALAIGGVAVATYNAIEAEKVRVREFEAGITSTLEAAGATERLVESLMRVGGASPPALAERFQAEAEAIAKLVAEQERLNKAREASARSQLLDTSLLAGGRVEGLRPQVDAEFDRIQRLEAAIARLADKTLLLSRANSESLGPAIDAMTQKFRELEDAGSGDWLDRLEAFGPRIAAAFTAGRTELDAMNTAYREAESIAATLSDSAKRASEELENLGKSEAERAAAQIQLFEQRALASGAFTAEQIAAKKAELAGYAAAVAALEREKNAIKSRTTAQREAERAQREQVRGWNEALRASATFQERLENLRAEMGGPLAQAQQQYNRDLAESAELARIAGASADELAETQERITALFNAKVSDLAKQAADAVKNSAKDMGRSWKDVLAEMSDTPFRRLLEDLKLVREGLEEATDPEVVARLEGALASLQDTMRSGLVDASMEALRGMQSLTENGSDAFKAMQVAIDALALVQGISAILNQGTGDPYSAPVRMAMMAAAIAPLIANLAGSIGSFGGGSGFSDTAAQRQESQGTGTVLGDPSQDSESIVRATEITADATSELVGINRGMLRALTALQSGIDSAGGMLARGAGAVEFAWPRDTELNEVGWGRFLSRLGDPIFGTGLLGRFLGGSSQVTDRGLALGGGSLSNITLQSYEEQQYRSWRFGSRRTREQFAPVGEEFEAQFQLIVDNIVTTVREGALALGMLPSEIDAALEAFRVEEMRISLKDLSPEEQQQELQAVFSAIFDDLAGDVVPYVAQFQRLGEGLGETLVRVATGVQVTREALDRLGFSLDATTPEQFAQISEGLIEMSGGIEEFINGMASFVDAFAPETHKFELLQSDLTRALAQAGLVVPATRDGMWELMNSLDATTEAGREQIATLLRLAGTADEYYSMLERQADEQAQAARQQIEAELEAEAQRVADLAALMDGFRSQAFDAAIALAEWNLTPLQRELAAIQRASQEAAQAAIELGATEEQLAEIRAGFATQSLLAQRRAEESLNQLLGGLQFDDALAGMSEIEQQIARNGRRYDDYIAQAIALGATEEQLAEIRAIQVRENERITRSAQGAADAIGRAGDQLRRIREFGADVRSSIAALGDDLRSWINQLTGYTPEVQGATATLAEAQAEIRRRFAQQEAGLQAERASLLRELLAQGWDEEAGGSGLISPTIRVLLGQLAAVDSALGGIGQSMVELEGYAALAFAARQQAVLDGLRQWRESLLQDTQLSVLTPAQRFADLQRQYLETLAAAESGDANAQQALQGIAQQYLQQAREMYASGEQYTAIFAQVLADTGALIEDVFGEGDGVESAIQALADAPVFAGQLAVLQSILDVLRGDDDGLPSYDVGTAFVPSTGPALIHRGETILPAAVADFARRSGLSLGPSQGMSSEPVVAELRALRDDVRRGDAAVAERLERVERGQERSANQLVQEQRALRDQIKVGSR